MIATVIPPRKTVFIRILFVAGGAAIAVGLVILLSVVSPSSQRVGASHSGWVHETSEYHSGVRNSIHHMSGDTRVIGTTASYLYAISLYFTGKAIPFMDVEKSAVAYARK